MPTRWNAKPEVQFLPGGQLLELRSPLAFIDSAGVRWEVPAGATVNDAAIPHCFRSLIGAPFTGAYRDACILHGWYCARRTRDWQDTHRVFHAALRASGVEPLTAATLYFAVRWGGPRWEVRTVANNNLRRADYFDRSLPNRLLVGNNAFEMGARKVAVPLPYPRERMGRQAQRDMVAELPARLAVNGIGLENIDRLADGMADRSLMVGGDGFEPPALSV